MEHFFGNIEDGEMVLNDIGRVADQCMKDVSVHFPHVVVDEFIIMPNHVHVILVVDGTGGRVAADGGFVRDVAMQRLYESDDDTLTDKQKYFSKISPHVLTLSTIIRSYKSACTYIINKRNMGPFKWQSNYYDHIIRNDRGLWAIRRYIRNNPQKRYRDRNNSQNLYM